jgi:hypothetical protein
VRSIRFRSLFLQARIYAARVGWLDLLGGVLLAAGLILYFAVVPRLHARLQAQQANLQEAQALLSRRARQSQSVPVRLPEVQQNLQNFYQVLGDVEKTERYLATMFEEAGKQGLFLDQAEYRLAYDKNGRFYTYSIKLPVSGSYIALRNFCEHLLLSLPYASLDDVSFKRREIGETTLDAKLHFTLYLNGPEGYAAGIAESAAKQGAAP